jgi:hypothetical protein
MTRRQGVNFHAVLTAVTQAPPDLDGFRHLAEAVSARSTLRPTLARRRCDHSERTIPT